MISSKATELKEIFRLAKAVPAQAAAIAEVNQQLYLPIDGFQWHSLEWADHEISRGHYFVVEDDRGIAGAICLHMLYAEKIGVIEAIAVRSDLHGRGIGKSMIDSAEHMFKGEGLQQSTVLSFHEYGLRDFYECCGFTCSPQSGVFRGHPYYNFSKALTPA